jgi:ribonuclease D
MELLSSDLLYAIARYDPRSIASLEAVSKTLQARISKDPTFIQELLKEIHD